MVAGSKLKSLSEKSKDFFEKCILPFTDFQTKLKINEYNKCVIEQDECNYCIYFNR